MHLYSTHFTYPSVCVTSIARNTAKQNKSCEHKFTLFLLLHTFNTKLFTYPYKINIYTVLYLIISLNDLE